MNCAAKVAPIKKEPVSPFSGSFFVLFDFFFCLYVYYTQTMACILLRLT